MKNQGMFLICSASIVLVCCFLTFGVTRAYYTEKQAEYNERRISPAYEVGGSWRSLYCSMALDSSVSFR